MFTVTDWIAFGFGYLLSVLALRRFVLQTSSGSDQRLGVLEAAVRWLLGYSAVAWLFCVGLRIPPVIFAGTPILSVILFGMGTAPSSHAGLIEASLLALLCALLFPFAVAIELSLGFPLTQSFKAKFILSPQLPVIAETLPNIVGKTGVVAVALRPQGQVRINDELIPAMSASGQMVEVSVGVRIIKVSNGRAVVVELNEIKDEPANDTADDC